jgi:hypothetical protein
MKGREARALIGPLERANLNHCICSVVQNKKSRRTEAGLPFQDAEADAIAVIPPAFSFVRSSCSQPNTLILQPIYFGLISSCHVFFETLSRKLKDNLSMCVINYHGIKPCGEVEV